MWPLLSPMWTGAGKTTKGQSQLQIPFHPNTELLLGQSRWLWTMIRITGLHFFAESFDTRWLSSNMLFHLHDNSGGKLNITSLTSSPTPFSLCSPTLYQPFWCSFLSPGPLQLHFQPMVLLVFAGPTPWVQFWFKHHNLTSEKAFPDQLINLLLQSTPFHPSYIFYHPTLSNFSASTLNYLKTIWILIC